MKSLSRSQSWWKKPSGQLREVSNGHELVSFYHTPLFIKYPIIIIIVIIIANIYLLSTFHEPRIE